MPKGSRLSRLKRLFQIQACDQGFFRSSSPMFERFVSRKSSTSGSRRSSSARTQCRSTTLTSNQVERSRVEFRSSCPNSPGHCADDHESRDMTEWWTWLNTNAAGVSAMAAVTTAFIAVVTMWASAADSRRRSRPYVLVDLRPTGFCSASTAVHPPQPPPRRPRMARLAAIRSRTRARGRAHHHL